MEQEMKNQELEAEMTARRIYAGMEKLTPLWTSPEAFMLLEVISDLLAHNLTSFH